MEIYDIYSHFVSLFKLNNKRLIYMLNQKLYCANCKNAIPVPSSTIAYYSDVIYIFQ